MVKWCILLPQDLKFGLVLPASKEVVATPLVHMWTCTSEVCRGPVLAFRPIGLCQQLPHPNLSRQTPSPVGRAHSIKGPCVFYSKQGFTWACTQRPPKKCQRAWLFVPPCLHAESKYLEGQTTKVVWELANQYANRVAERPYYICSCIACLICVLAWPWLLLKFNSVS